jgi:hypothetical protein
MATLYGGPLPLSTASAQVAFTDALSTASLIVAVIAALGALLTWRHLPTGALITTTAANPEAARAAGGR